MEVKNTGIRQESRPSLGESLGSLLIVPQLLSAVELVFGLDVDRQMREECLDELVSDLKG